MRIIKANEGTLDLGKQGENNAVKVLFDTSEYKSTYGEGTFSLAVNRSGEDQLYLVPLVTEGEYVAWTVTSADNAIPGRGKCELRYYVGGAVVKSETFVTTVEESIGDDTEDAPEPSAGWLDKAAAYADTALSAAKAAADSAEAATASAKHIDALEVSAETLPPSQTATVEKITGADGVVTFRFGLPKGDSGAPDDGQIYDAVGKWITDHPDSTTVIPDKFISSSMISDGLLDALLVSKTTSGDTVTFEDGADSMPLKSITVDIKTRQAGSGTPSLTNVRTISKTDKVTVIRTGKNIMSFNGITSTGGGISVGYDEDNSEYVINGTSTAQSATALSGQIKIYAKKGENCTLSCRAVSGSVFVGLNKTVALRLVGSDGTVFTGSASDQLDGYVYTFTAPETDTFTVKLVLSGSGISFNSYHIVLQTEIGASATDYEKYDGQIVEIPLDGCGNVYGGTLDVTGGTLTVNSELVTFDGNDSVDFYSGFSDVNRISWSGYQRIGVARGEFISDKLKFVSTTDAHPGEWEIANTSVPRMFIGLPKSISTADEWHTFCSSNPIQVVYKTAASQEYTVSKGSLSTLLKYNRIYSPDGAVTLTYRADPTTLYDSLSSITPASDEVIKIKGDVIE